MEDLDALVNVAENVEGKIEKSIICWISREFQVASATRQELGNFIFKLKIHMTFVYKFEFKPHDFEQIHEHINS